MTTTTIDNGERGAVLSDDLRYRYRLWRTWDPDTPRMVWVMLNPSTAGAYLDDPTIRRCRTFAARDGYGGIDVINLYALRASKPKHLLDHPAAEGPENAAYWKYVLNGPLVGAVVAAWGAFNDPRLPISYTAARFDADMDRWLCLGHTRAGYPRHPLYVRADAPFRRLRRASVPA